MIDLSVIMPVHNAGIYLREAIETLKNQIYKDFELICIDDCSTDNNTIEILNEYENEGFIRVTRLIESSGAANARNIGLSLAQTDYVIFLDSDDLFDEHLLSDMMSAIKKEDSDICICEYDTFRTVNGNKEIVGTFRIDQDIALQATDEKYLTILPTNPWTKICKRQYLIDNNIRFQSLSSSNDVFFSNCAILYTERRSFVFKPLIMYRSIHENSISKNRKASNFYYAFEATYNKMQSDGSITSIHEKMLFYNLILSSVGEMLGSVDDDDNMKFYYLVKKFLRKNHTSFNDRSVNNLVRCYKLFSYKTWRWGIDRGILRIIGY